MTEDQRTRLEEIEADIDAAVADQLQYYPFGHDFDKYYAPHDRMLSGDNDPLPPARRVSRLQEIHSHSWRDNKGMGKRR